jgi:hypothetical protein
MANEPARATAQEGGEPLGAPRTSVWGAGLHLRRLVHADAIAL